MDGRSRLITIRPVLQFAGAYSAGGQMGSVLTLVAGADNVNFSGAVLSLVVIDKAKQSSALDVLFFNASPTLTSTDNTALSISDAEMEAKFIGRVSIAATDYTATAVNSDATVKAVGLLSQGTPASTSLFAVVQSQGTPTYTSASDLVIKVGILQD